MECYIASEKDQIIPGADSLILASLNLLFTVLHPTLNPGSLTLKFSFFFFQKNNYIKAQHKA